MAPFLSLPSLTFSGPEVTGTVALTQSTTLSLSETWFSCCSQEIQCPLQPAVCTSRPGECTAGIFRGIEMGGERARKCKTFSERVCASNKVCLELKTENDISLKSVFSRTYSISKPSRCFPLPINPFACRSLACVCLPHVPTGPCPAALPLHAPTCQNARLPLELGRFPFPSHSSSSPCFAQPSLPLFTLFGVLPFLLLGVSSPQT